MRNVRAIVIVVSLAVALSYPIVVQAQLAEGTPPGKPFGNPWIDVRTYGAKGDGMTDDTTAIQKALTAAVSSKAPVLVPAGNYKITGVLNLREGQSFFGVGDSTKLIAFTNNQAMLNLKGSQIQVRGMFLTTAPGVTGVIGVYINPDGDVHANFNKLHTLRIEGVATGVLIQGGLRLDGGDMGAWYNSLVDINMRFVTDGVKLTSHGLNLANGANATRAYNVRVGECETGWRITRADTANVFGFAAEGCTTGVHIEESLGADNNSNVFFGLRFEGTTTEIRVDANSHFNGFVGFEPRTDKILDDGVSTTFLGTCCRIQFDGLSYSNLDPITNLNAISILNAINGVRIINNDGIGTLGVGTTDPQQELDVVGSLRLSTGDIYRPDNAGVAAQFGDGVGTFLQNTHVFKNAPGSQTWMIITNGKVGMGTTNPAFELDVAGAAHASSFPTSSDVRLKTNIASLTNVLKKLEKIRGVSFEWNDVYESLGRSTGRREIGVIAQEVEAVFPELVTTWGAESYRAVDYGRLTGILIEALKELRAEKDAQIAALEVRLATLEQADRIRGTTAYLSSSSLPSSWPLLGGILLVGLVLGRRWRAGEQ